MESSECGDHLSWSLLLLLDLSRSVEEVLKDSNK